MDAKSKRTSIRIMEVNRNGFAARGVSQNDNIMPTQKDDGSDSSDAGLLKQETIFTVPPYPDTYDITCRIQGGFRPVKLKNEVACNNCRSHQKPGWVAFRCRLCSDHHYECTLCYNNVNSPTFDPFLVHINFSDNVEKFEKDNIQEYDNRPISRFVIGEIIVYASLDRRDKIQKHNVLIGGIKWDKKRYQWMILLDMLNLSGVKKWFPEDSQRIISDKLGCPYVIGQYLRVKSDEIRKKKNIVCKVVERKKDLTFGEYKVLLQYPKNFCKSREWMYAYSAKILSSDKRWDNKTRKKAMKEFNKSPPDLDQITHLDIWRTTHLKPTSPMNKLPEVNPHLNKYVNEFVSSEPDNSSNDPSFLLKNNVQQLMQQQQQSVLLKQQMQRQQNQAAIQRNFPGINGPRQLPIQNTHTMFFNNNNNNSFVRPPAPPTMNPMFVRPPPIQPMISQFIQQRPAMFRQPQVFRPVMSMSSVPINFTSNVMNSLGVLNTPSVMANVRPRSMINTRPHQVTNVRPLPAMNVRPTAQTAMPPQQQQMMMPPRQQMMIPSRQQMMVPSQQQMMMLPQQQMMMPPQPQVSNLKVHANEFVPHSNLKVEAAEFVPGMTTIVMQETAPNQILSSALRNANAAITAPDLTSNSEQKDATLSASAQEFVPGGV